jgi:hypothetical protein
MIIIWYLTVWSTASHALICLRLHPTILVHQSSSSTSKYTYFAASQHLFRRHIHLGMILCWMFKLKIIYIIQKLAISLFVTTKNKPKAQKSFFKFHFPTSFCEYISSLSVVLSSRQIINSLFLPLQTFLAVQTWVQPNRFKSHRAVVPLTTATPGVLCEVM